MRSWLLTICGLACLIGARPAGATLPPGHPLGDVKFGTFTAGLAQSRADLEANCSAPTLAGAVADVVITGISIPGAPGFEFANNVTGHVMVNGDIIVDEQVSLTPPEEPEYQFVSLRYSQLKLGTFGARADKLFIFLPAGFGVGVTGPNDKKMIDFATLNNVTLGPGLVPTGNVTLNRQAFTGIAGSAPLYPIVDRAPVRFETGSITWTPANGQFSFNQNSGVDLIYHDEFAIGLREGLKEFFPTYVVDAFLPVASNELYYLSAKEVLSTVRVNTRRYGGANLLAAEFTLDPNKFGSLPDPYLLHYPKLFMNWTQTAGSKIRFTGGQVDVGHSVLKGASGHPNGFVPEFAYAKGLPPVDPDGDCPVTTTIPFGQYRFVPENQEWKFTRDGGLRAEGDIFRPGSPSNKLRIEWGYFESNGIDRYAHRLYESFSKARVSSAGVAAPGDVTDLLFSGHSAPGDDNLLERPGSAGYLAGLADYPGVNVRVGASTVNAVSRLANKNTPNYQLDPSSKYVLRFSGVTGRHVSVPNTTINISAYGIDFNLSGIALAYCNGENRASGINGGMNVPAPADFTLNFERLRFGDQGQFLGAAIAPGQGAKPLTAWNLNFKPLALNFPQPKACPSPGPGVGWVSITAESTLKALSSDPMTGTIDLDGGDIVSAADIIAMTDPGKQPPPVSSFKPNGNLLVNGPDGTHWTVNPVTEVMINQWAKNHPSESQGTLTVGGLMDVPFFKDMPVALSANSGNTGASTPTKFVRAPYQSLESLPWDPEHRGRKSGNTLDFYRTDDSNNPIAERSWQDIVDFRFPLKHFANGVFRSEEAVPGDLFMFRLNERVTSMTPSGLEMIFDAQLGALPLPQVNVGGLLAGTVSDLVRAPLEDALGGLGAFDALLADDVRDLLADGLATAASDSVDIATINELADPEANRISILTNLSADVRIELAKLLSADGDWTSDLQSVVSDARAGIATVGDVVNGAAGLAAGIASEIGSGGEIGAAPEGRVDELVALLASIDKQLEDVGEALDGGSLTAALSNAFGSSQQEDISNAALFDLLPKWAPANPNQAAALYASASPAQLRTMFAQDLAKALAARTAGNEFAGDAMRLLRLYLADSHTLSKQAVDDVLRMAEQMIADASPPIADPEGVVNGSIKEYLGSAELRGYARINGDSLKELRLDGHLTLKVPDDMKFDGWFLLRDVDSNTPGGACIDAAGVKTEIAMGASGEMSWGSPDPITLKLGGKVGIDENGHALSICGDLGIGGEFDLNAVTIRELQLGFGFGGPEGYLYGRAAGKVASMDVEAGIFAGQTCNLEIVKNADQDIGSLLASQNVNEPTESAPLIGAAIYAEGGMSLMPLIGVPPSCVLDLRLHGGQGFFGFDRGGTQIVGIKTLQGVSGELLCIVDVSGKLATVYAINGNFTGGSPDFDSFTAAARATLRGELDLGLFSVGFERSKKMTITADPDVSWKFD